MRSQDILIDNLTLHWDNIRLRNVLKKKGKTEHYDQVVNWELGINSIY